MMKKKEIINSKNFILSPSLNRAPSHLKHIHLMGICGTGMASLAGILKKKGYFITGSDENIYPPMSLFLEELSIDVFKGYSPENLKTRPDLVIVGNVITKDNPEAVRLSKDNIPYLSMPQALKYFAFGDKKTIVISGTHGKTTTSALASWILEKSGIDPGFMIGGILKNFGKNFRIGNGSYFVIEGDEYDTAFFDKGPKFLHYYPRILILTSIEFDHADIFKDLDHIIECFRRLIGLIPEEGLLIANGDDSVVLNISKDAKCPVLTYGFNDKAMWRPVDISTDGSLTSFKVLKNGIEHSSILTSLYGNYNISNLLSAIILSDHLKIDNDVMREAIISFTGVRRRQEIKGEVGGVTVLDDFAHHPTAVEKTIEGVKGKYMDRRLIAVFEPRSNSSRRNVFQERYSRSFDRADMIFIPEPPMMEKIPPQERFSSIKLVNALNQKGLKAFYCSDSEILLKEITSHVQKGDVILIMSNGSFDNIHDKLLDKLYALISTSFKFS